MVTKVQNWGNSQGLRLNRQVLEEAHIGVGDEVNVSVRDGLIVIAPTKRVRGHQDLRKLVARIPKGTGRQRSNGDRLPGGRRGKCQNMSRRRGTTSPLPLTALGT